MELIDVIQRIAAGTMQGMGPTDLAYGTVTGVDPLEVTVEDTRTILPAAALCRTSAVVERKIPVLAHKHTVTTLAHSHTTGEGGTSSALDGSYETSTALSQVACQEDGKPLPVKDGYILLNRGLEQGDKVLLLRARGGQRYIILSRVF